MKLNDWRNWSDEDWAKFIVCNVATLFLCLFLYVVLTDEYTVVESKEEQCIEYHVSSGECAKKQMRFVYSCRIVSGETLRICSEPTECSDYCSKIRGY